MAEILLTGQRGYLGACVAQALRRAGLAFDPLPGRLEEIGANALPHTLVLHCAGALRHRLDRLDTANAQGMRHLLAGLAHRARVIFVSSRAVYAPTDRPIIDERAELGPRGDAYGSSKLDAERALMASRHDWLILRPTTLFGWGVDGWGHAWLGSAAERLLAGQPISVYAPDRPEDFLYVHSLAAVILRALSAKADAFRTVANVAGPTRGLHGIVGTLAELVRDRLGLPGQVNPVSGPPRRAPLLDCRRCEQLLGPIEQATDARILADMIDRRLAARAAAGNAPISAGAVHHAVGCRSPSGD